VPAPGAQLFWLSQLQLETSAEGLQVLPVARNDAQKCAKCLLHSKQAGARSPLMGSGELFVPIEARLYMASDCLCLFPVQAVKHDRGQRDSVSDPLMNWA